MVKTIRLRFHNATLAAERKWPFLLALFALIFAALTLLLDLRRPLTNDELFTFYISQQPTLHDVWNALLTGAEQLPLLFFVVVRIFTGVLGASPIVLRLPDTLGFLLMNVCIFFFVRRRVPACYGLIGFIFPAATGAYYYAFEARPYGLVMGFCGLAMLSWQNAAQERKRPLSLLGIAIFLGLAINCHYYALLLFLPFGVAELIRYYERRRLDWPLYLAIAVSAVPLIFSLPVIRAASQFSSHFWSKPSWSSLVSFYEYVLMPAGLALMLMALVAGFGMSRDTDSDSVRESGLRAPAHELGLAFGFVLLPILGVFLGKFVTGAFNSRHAIYAVIGLAILLSLSLARICRHQRVLGLVLAVIVLGCWLVSAARQYQLAVANQVAQNGTFQFLRSAAPDLPLVIAAPQPFFVQSYVAATEHRGHFTYLADVPLALKYTDTDTVERGLLALRSYAPIDVQDYHSFAATHRRFLLYGFPDPFGWLMQDLTDSGRSISVVGRNGDSLLYLVADPHS